MKKTRAICSFLSGFAMVSLYAGNAHSIGGAGIGNEVPSARAAGQGYTATAAQNDDLNTVYSNPAGITKLPGLQVAFGSTYENLNGSYQGSTGPSVKMRTGHSVIPNGAITYTDPAGILGFGVGIYSNYGLQTQWPSNSSLRYVATNSTLKTISLHPSVAVKVAKELSIGVGAQYINAFDVKLEKHLDNFNSTDANSVLSGKGSKWGVQAGILIEPTEKHAIGIAYHSKMRVKVRGNLDISDLSGPLSLAFGGATQLSTTAESELIIPQNLQIGYAFKPNEKFMWEVDVARFGWSDNQSLPITTPISALNTPIPLKWRSTWNVGTGINYKYSEKTAYRVGFWYEPHATNEAAFTPATLDLSRYAGTVGMGYSLSSSIRVDMAYNAIFFKQRNVSPTDFSGISGKYNNFVNLATIGFTFKF